MTAAAGDADASLVLQVKTDVLDLWRVLRRQVCGGNVSDYISDAGDCGAVQEQVVAGLEQVHRPHPPACTAPSNFEAVCFRVYVHA
jgi:hypothetical protein